ncbi:site-specific integrase [Mesonia mobilis]|uniref:Transposase n=1 Tax=Mesonia mobilis TaxID=369791 RepID=A0ABQ3BYH7_9FLAO|nr:site-specific integrase [Mesonia mobilis]MBQ0738085.1 site-specific integrase [Aquimarina celericrescens]GGZ61632.1 transposase [Mesonia mobilis]
MQTIKTFSIHFWINKSKRKDSNAPLYARITVEKKRVEISLKQMAPIEKWDKRSQQVKGRSFESKQINNYLDQCKAQLFNCYSDLKSRNELITAKKIKATFLGEDNDHKSLIELVTYHNDKMQSKLKWGTLKNYYSTEKYLKNFLNEKKHTSDIYLSELDYKFIVDFEHYLNSGKYLKKSQPLSNNGVMKHLERLKKLTNLALKLEWLDKDPFFQFKLKFQKFDRVFLNQQELEKLETSYLEKRVHQIVRDIFVFSCYTGLSYIDVKNLTKSHLTKGMNGKDWIFTQRAKSEEYVKIPLLPKAKQILQQYESDSIKEGKLLPVYSNQKINNYIKEICKLVGIPKSISFHSARHTFATTVTLNNGVPIETVSKLLGHSKLSTTQVYARVLQSKIGMDMDNLEERLKAI